MLGDGHIQKRSSLSNSRFIYSQSGKHEDYFNLIYSIFNRFCTNEYKPSMKLNKKGYKHITLATMALPCFNYYHEIFYLNKKKVVPENINELLTEVSLAYWIMDDGSKQGKGIHLNTYGFTQECVKRLVLVLETKFNLKCSLHIKNKQHRIFIWAKSKDLLKSYIITHIHPSMLYKLT